jgi:hypothetical protein
MEESDSNGKMLANNICNSRSEIVWIESKCQFECVRHLSLPPPSSKVLGMLIIYVCCVCVCVSFFVLLFSEQVYNKREELYTSRSKYEGRKVTEDRMSECMAPFFNNGIVFRADVVAFFITRLEKLLEVFLEQKSLRFYSSSILLIYEGDETEESGAILGLPHCDIRMVDFANVYDYHDGELDSGYILGLRSTLQILKDILHMHKEGREFSLFDEDLGENDDDHLG